MLAPSDKPGLPGPHGFKSDNKTLLSHGMKQNTENKTGNHRWERVMSDYAVIKGLIGIQKETNKLRTDIVHKIRNLP